MKRYQNPTLEETSKQHMYPKERIEEAYYWPDNQSAIIKKYTMVLFLDWPLPHQP
jgi:hypothetical protein